jgi:hypothetical protein
MPVEAFRSIALGCLEHFQRNEKGLHEGAEAEFVHQARVALRRLRSAIKLFAPVLPPEFVTAYGQTWQTLAGALGDARNWDVFLEETLPSDPRRLPGKPRHSPPAQRSPPPRQNRPARRYPHSRRERIPAPAGRIHLRHLCAERHPAHAPQGFRQRAHQQPRPAAPKNSPPAMPR